MQISLPDYTRRLESGEIHIKFDPEIEFISVVVIHSTKLGPALGGCRFIQYPNLDAAMTDCVRLARGMSYKAATADLDLGGGKAVIIKPNNNNFDREAIFTRFGQFVETLNGRYITAVDSGTNINDIEIISKQTKHLCGVKAHGDPSPHTAKGVFNGIKAAVKFRLGHDDLSGVHIVMQGIGNVGYPLAKHLIDAGAKITAYDVNKTNLERAAGEIGIEIAQTDKCYTIPCDVYSPCALGGVLNDETIETLNCKIVAGAANNQLLRAYHADKLHEKGILYAPDYVINAGGLIHCETKVFNRSDEERERKINHIYDIMMTIFDRAKNENISPEKVADLIAEERLKN